MIKTSKDEFGDRMKMYESAYTSSRVPPDDVLCVRIDGKRFSKFTKNYKKPADSRISTAMLRTAISMVDETNANLGYVQSDEITLIYSLSDKATEPVYGGKVSKLNSILASMATGYFNSYIEDAPYTAHFDCRSWGVPTLIEASNVVLWRAQDAERNSVSSAYRWAFGHSKMQGLSKDQMLDELGDKWVDMPAYFKHGCLVTCHGESARLNSSFFGGFTFEERLSFVQREEKV